MSDRDPPDSHSLPAAAELSISDVMQRVRLRTPARLLVGRSGPAYRTGTQLELRRDHAVALDAVHAELDLQRDFGPEFIERWRLFQITTEARDKTEYLMRPDLGRRLGAAARAEVIRRCPAGADLQIAIGDGLSATAVATQVPELLALLEREAKAAGWMIGQPFAMQHCRVGVMNDIGELLQPTVVVLLIGERPGLATAESLSAYMAYRPRAGHTDADRNLISNIHRRGVSPEAATQRIIALAAKMRSVRTSGVSIKEDFPAMLRLP